MERKMTKEKSELEENTDRNYEPLSEDFKNSIEPGFRYAIEALANYDIKLHQSNNSEKSIMPYIGSILFLDVLNRLSDNPEYQNQIREIFKDYLKETSNWNDEKINKYFKTP
ncbi:hypothetical protein KY304_01485 [Candidatus Woesearchaeota archaeon]|nr:hypothetical protein [Candidatus Woesearchaeota archaeon]